MSDGLLTEAQKKEKWNAIAETIKYTNDKNDRKYQQYIEDGNLRAAAQMVKEAAKRANYTMHLYHGSRNGGGIHIFKNWQYFTENKA